jgi:hypothetical protein
LLEQGPQDVVDQHILNAHVAEGYRLWNSQLDDIEKAWVVERNAEAGKAIRSIVEEVHAPWAEYQGRLADQWGTAGHLGEWYKRLYSRYHALRAYGWHWNPQEQYAVLEASSPVTAAVLNHEIAADARHLGSSTRGGAKPWVQRKILDERTQEMLGVMPFRERAFLEATSLGKVLARARIAEDVLEKAQRGAPFMGRTPDEMAQWALEGVDPAKLGKKSPFTWLRNFIHDTLHLSYEGRQAYIQDRLGNDPRLLKQIFERWGTQEWKSMLMPGATWTRRLTPCWWSLASLGSCRLPASGRRSWASGAGERLCRTSAVRSATSKPT